MVRPPRDLAMAGPRSRPVLLAVLALLAPAPSAPARAGDFAQVAIWEKLPSPWDWRAPRALPDDRFEVPALGFVGVPARYNARGIEVDRSVSFALHAEA